MSAIWLTLSCSMMEAWTWDSLETSLSHFFEGRELSIFPSGGWQGEAFQWWVQHFWIWDLSFWQRVGTLSGRGFCSCLGSSLGGLDSCLAVHLVCVSASSLGAKSLCPSTQWILTLQIPCSFAIFLLPCLLAS